MFVPSREVSRFRLVVDGRDRAEVSPQPRPDVAAAYPRHPAALRSGFRFDGVDGPGDSREWQEVEVRALGTEGDVLGRTWTLCKPDFSPRESPPPEMMKRVSNVSNQATFWRLGLQSFSTYMRAIRDEHRGASPPRILDWGCGCGRVIALFQKHFPTADLQGCDIDHRAVSWCSERLRPARFSVIDPDPPLPYPNGSFDVALGNSVFTHLARTAQSSWLDELRRILRPGGLLLATTQGPFVADLVANEGVRNDLASEGISDYLEKDTLAGVAPAGSYREVFQTEPYTRSAWSRGFEILRYEEAGMNNFQDFWVLRAS